MASIFVDIFTKLNRTSVDNVDRQIQQQMQKAGQNAANAFSREMESASPRIRKAAGAVVDSNSRVTESNKKLEAANRRIRESTQQVADGERKLADVRRGTAITASEGVKLERELYAARRDLAAANRDAARGSDEFTRAVKRQHDALRSLRDAKVDDAHRHRRGGGGGGRGGGFLGEMAGSIPGVPGGRAGVAIGGGLVAMLGSVAEAATTATQALWLLPAAATAGGAGFLTLKMGLSGFDKALKASDPKKFAEALQNLAPNAQQAAMEIRQLAGGLDGLKSVTQNELFRGVARQLSDLGKQFMPEVKQMTTGIASAMNEMFGNVAGQLKTPGTSAAIHSLMENIVQSFRNLAPAMGPVVDAFARIAKVGSDFLPGMATGIANLATKFAQFIQNAQQSGKLQEWIQRGIDAASTLGHVIGDIGHRIFDVFGNKSPQEFQSTLHGMVDAAVSVAQAIAGVSHVVNTLINDLQPVANMIGGWPNLIYTVAAAWGAWKVATTIAQLGRVAEMLGVTIPASAKTGSAAAASSLGMIGTAAAAATTAVGTLAGAMAAVPHVDNFLKSHTGLPLPDTDHWNWFKQPFREMWGDIRHPSRLGKGNLYDQNGNYIGPGSPGGPPPGYMGGGGSFAPPDQLDNKPATSGPGWASRPNNQFGAGSSISGATPWNNIPVPAVPGKAGGKGKLPKVTTPFDPSYGAGPRPGESEGQYDAEGALMQAKHRLADDKATLLAMEQGNTANEQQIQAQKNKIVQDQRDVNKAQLELAHAQQNANKKQLSGYKSMNDSMQDLGPKLDEDFGLSQGLPGLAKNLVEFIGKMAAAPLLGQLDAVKKGDPYYTGGYGALGIMAEHNHMNGRSALLGIPAGMPGGPSASSAAYGGPGGPYGGPGASAGSGGYAGDAALLSRVPSGRYDASGDLLRGLGDCSSAVEDLVNIMDGRSTAGRQMSTGNEAQWLTQHGFMPTNVPMPGTFQVGMNNHHTQATLPGGTPFNWGSDAAAARRGIGGTGAWDPAFTQHFFRPVGAWSGGPVTSGLPGSSPAMGGGGGTVPVFVTNMPGGGFALPSPTAHGAPGSSGTPAAPGGPPTAGGGKQVGPGPGAGGRWRTNADGSKTAIDANGNATGGYIPGAGGKPSGPASPAVPFPGPSTAGQPLNPLLTPFAKQPGAQAWSRFLDPDSAMHNPPSPFNPSAATGPSPSMPGVKPAGYERGGTGGNAPPGPGGGTPGFPMPGGPGAQEGNPTPQGAPQGGGWQPSGGAGLGIGGMPAAAITSAAGMFPGGGAAAQLAMKLANRSIQQVGEYAAIGVQGLQETFGVHDPDGGGGGLDGLQNNIFGRVLKGLAKAKPATGTSAGKTQGKKDDKNQGKDAQGKPGQQGGDQYHGGMHIGGDLNITTQPGQNPQTTYNDLSYMGAMGASTPLAL